MNSDDREVLAEVVNVAVVGVRVFSSSAAPDVPPNAKVGATGATRGVEV